MQRYFVEPSNMGEREVMIEGNDVKHITRVMRMGVGDHIICLNNNGREVLAQIDKVENHRLVAKIVKEHKNLSELPVSVAIAQALIKGDKLDYVVQKCTEFGAKAIYLFASDRSVVKWDQQKSAKKIARLKKIAKKAAEQSGRLFIPDISFTSHLVEATTEVEMRLFLDEEKAKKHDHTGLFDALHQHPSSLLAVVGPEGGLSEQEKTIFCEHGFQGISLGPRILRSESAAIYTLSALSYHYELSR
ncbi:RsmE family RNA methyltransferase [Aliibacillus thermotolerans]|uniref:Ribosomal RNA small subunit methyltransferase E n=1 Tax=Aliibacillus thermotolerans TaxID=1834418 RepID=A0ABW0U8G5_9BACI|nr:RsmE family RNA methyltransferase [Aliibacillus thermotolerans]MDA3130749.1 RsmE family RNA methyltransferase [Aliibacillus thermotolerans]